jgi:hypothetical protein
MPELPPDPRPEVPGGVPVLRVPRADGGAALRFLRDPLSQIREEPGDGAGRGREEHFERPLVELDVDPTAAGCHRSGLLDPLDGAVGEPPVHHRVRRGHRRTPRERGRTTDEQEVLRRGTRRTPPRWRPREVRGHRRRHQRLLGRRLRGRQAASLRGCASRCSCSVLLSQKPMRSAQAGAAGNECCARTVSPGVGSLAPTTTSGGVHRGGVLRWPRRRARRICSYDLDVTVPLREPQLHPCRRPRAAASLHTSPPRPSTIGRPVTDCDVRARLLDQLATIVRSGWWWW